jgi:hypothetical protein
MTRAEIYKEVLNRLPDDAEWYSPSEGILCNDFWCYKCKDEVITLSNIEPNSRRVYWTNKQNKMREEIKTSGYDYTKGHIVLTADGEIVDGYHRFISLSENYHPNSKIMVKRLTNFYSDEMAVSLYFYLLYILPIKFINILFKSLISVFK